MTDLQALFHNPESFSDRDLSKVLWKLKVQAYFPYATAGAGGAAMFMYDTAILRKSMCLKRLGLAGVAGFVIGGLTSYKIVGGGGLGSYSDVTQDNFDKEIMGAFEEKYVSRSLNAAGYGSNALNFASHTKERNAMYKKPY